MLTDNHAIQTLSSYHAEFNRGRDDAAAFITDLRTRSATPFALAEIVSGFPPELTATERGFLSEICSQLM